MSVAEVIAAYFRGEKSEAALIMLAGAVSLAAALWLWFSVREPFARGLAAALLLTAALGRTRFRPGIAVATRIHFKDVLRRFAESTGGA